METQKNINWLQEELDATATHTEFNGEVLPLKLETGKITKFKIDFTNKFNTWTSADGVVKAIIPVEHKGEKKNLWVNKRNPLYQEITKRGIKGQINFAVSTVGTQKETRYTIVDED
jgi:flagellin-like hook-associated protein FlgL